ITSQPLSAPTASANSSEANSASQTLHPACTASSAVTSTVDAVITPADRSNSPPIINSAKATATMPRVDASSSQVVAPSGVRNLSVTIEKNTNTAAAPSAAPASGR